MPCLPATLKWPKSSQSSNQNIGWWWNGSDEEPWQLLQTRGDLSNTYVVCLHPTVAAYDSDIGLRLGVAGNQESPERVEPKHPGYAPLHAESWTAHARAVAREAQRRLEKEHWQTGLLGSGLERRYGLPAEAVAAAVKTCALLHDLGKLQDNWQRWAEAAQRSRDTNYQHRVPLAHTDFDPESAEDKERERSLSIRRPAHAPASAYYGRVALVRLLTSVPDNQRAYVASACTAAILSHHGGWWPTDLEQNPPKLWPEWEDALAQALGWSPKGRELTNLRKYRVENLLKATTGADSLAEWWPLVAYLMRTLRLSDQRATAERACHE